MLKLFFFLYNLGLITALKQIVMFLSLYNQIND